MEAQKVRSDNWDIVGDILRFDIWVTLGLSDRTREDRKPMENEMDLGIAGRKAIVCASSRGLGRACAERLAEAGCEVVINGLNPNDSRPRRRI